ncbi:DeoR/GlpR family DNA-binding transcription regulator [Paenibacillus solisilvae]|uniref:DeoR/GlpR family DNA-binding transcription regulator n=1 Tax=Paenibacillus solisilvae TaxID=2486751 RepID=A0ABW0VXH0_9BACL
MDVFFLISINFDHFVSLVDCLLQISLYYEQKSKLTINDGGIEFTVRNRPSEIIRLLTIKPFMTIEELSAELDVSPATIRRDLTELENSDSILRVNGGGAILRRDRKEAEDRFFEEKKRIAASAVSLVKEGDTIFLDSGSTNLHLADQLFAFSNITLVTNNIRIANKFINRKDLSVIICGGTLGEVNPESIVGPVAENMISSFRANICFIGTSGININQGITDPYLSSARIKEKMIENSNKVVLVTDHSKFGVINTHFVCSIDEIDHIVTDKLAPEEDINFMMDKGISVTF